MKLKISNFRGYRYRRFALGLKALALVWVGYVGTIYFTNPGTQISSIAFSVLLFIGGVTPLLLLAAACEDIAEHEFTNRRVK